MRDGILENFFDVAVVVAEKIWVNGFGDHVDEDGHQERPIREQCSKHAMGTEVLAEGDDEGSESEEGVAAKCHEAGGGVQEIVGLADGIGNEVLEGGNINGSIRIPTSSVCLLFKEDPSGGDLGVDGLQVCEDCTKNLREGVSRLSHVATETCHEGGQIRQAHGEAGQGGSHCMRASKSRQRRTRSPEQLKSIGWFSIVGIA